MRAKLRPGIALAALLSLAPVDSARAGPSIANPRQVEPRLAASDSLRVQKLELGVLFGTPAVIDGEAGYWPGPVVGVRASGLWYRPGLWGGQGNLCFTLHRSARGRQCAALVAGGISIDSDDWRYGGIAYDVNEGPFFLEVGLVMGTGSLFNRDPQAGVVFQLGLMGGGGVRGPR